MLGGSQTPGVCPASSPNKQLLKTLGNSVPCIDRQKWYYSGLTSCCRIGAGSLNLGTIGIWGQKVWCGDCPVRGRRLSRVPGSRPPEPVASCSTQLCQPKNVSKCCQMSLIKQLSASFKLEDHTKLALSKQLVLSVGWCPIPFLPQSWSIHISRVSSFKFRCTDFFPFLCIQS